MRVAVDFRVLSTEAANRGMGRVTQQQLREVLERDSENEYLVITYPGVRDDIIYPEIRNAPNVAFKRLAFPDIEPGMLIPFAVEALLPKDKLLAFSARFQEFLHREDVDLYHDTTPFLGEAVPRLDVCPSVATLYDLIPLIFPREYLTHEELRAYYRRALHKLLGAARLISISESARNDAYTYLGYPKSRIDVAYPLVESIFRLMSESLVESTLSGLRSRLEVPRQYALSVTGVHHSKNAETLLAAYASLPAGVRRELPLLVVLPTEEAQHRFARAFTVPPTVLLIHSVSDEELAALYNRALFVVCTSRYEGFGLPVVEAMKCGAPAIISAAGSLPEVADAAAVLVYPHDVRGFAAAMERLFADPRVREVMRERGLHQAAKFSPEQLGTTTLDAYRKALAGAAVSPPDAPAVIRWDVHPRRDRRRIAIWSSLPPLKCGVGDYTAELVQQLAPMVDVEAFVDGGYLPAEWLVNRYPVHHHAAFDRRDRQWPFDIVIYQIGGTFMQAFMYDQIKRRPGIVTIHDLEMGLGFFYVHHSWNQLDKFRKEFLAPEGSRVVRAFKDIMRRARDFPHAELDDLFRADYLLRWVTKSSLAEIVHLPQLKRDLEVKYDDANVFTVHMGVVDPWAAQPSCRPRLLRAKYGLSPTTFVVGVFGSVVSAKRLEPVLSALRQIVDTHPDTLLLVIGDQVDLSYVQNLRAMVSALDVQRHVCFVDYAPRADFDNLMLCADVVVNLRYPTRKGMSAILIRALAAGKPVVITDVPEWADFPAQFVWRVKPDQTEADALAATLLQAGKDRDFLKAASVGARAYFERHGTLSEMAVQYLDVIERVAGAQTGPVCSRPR